MTPPNNIRYKNVTAPEELYNIIRLRDEILLKELDRIASKDIYDPHDRTGFNFFAYEEGNPEIPLGAIRTIDEGDLKYLDNGEKRLEIRNADIEPYRGARDFLVGRFIVPPGRRGAANIAPGLFGCVYLHGHDYGTTGIFIVANCEMKPGEIEIPKGYLSLGFRQIGEIRRKYYDDFDIHSAPMHASREDLIGNPMRKAYYERFRGRIGFEFLPPEERMGIYEEAVDMWNHSKRIQVPVSMPQLMARKK